MRTRASVRTGRYNLSGPSGGPAGLARRALNLSGTVP